MAALRTGLTVILLALLLGLTAGCQTAPPAVSATVESEAAPRSLGFVPVEDGWMLDVATPILFETDRADLGPETRAAIAKMAEALLKIGVQRIRLEGHTDELGSREYNVELSLRRAEAVSRELAAHGFPQNAIVRRGLGYEHPVAANDTREGRALNRRVTIMVLAPD
jgi:outer membrane protein OmpA-like peptidoglycan-associated protein